MQPICPHKKKIRLSQQAGYREFGPDGRQFGALDAQQGHKAVQKQQADDERKNGFEFHCSLLIRYE
jgi:hypothetical protein